MNKNTANKEDEKEVAIEVENLSKSFRVPHEKTTTLKGAALGLFSKKNYTEFSALEDINFKVKKGEFLGIIGRNGSGKSTLLKILAGIYVPDKGKGKVKIKGKLSPFLELGVGFNPELTGRENLFLGGAILGLSRNEVSEKFDKIVSFAELEDFIDMKMKNYSSGMQVRLAFSLAINAHADLLLMDEVLAVGDSNFQIKCLEVFNNYKTQGKTVILVTHDIGVVQRYCDRAILLRDGRMTAIGKADRIVEKYITQNMADGEDKINKDESVEKGKLTPLKIKKVSLFGNDGNEKTGFKTGETMSVRVVLEKSKNYREAANVGVGIYNDNGSYVMGCNTQMDQHMVKGDISEITFLNMPLLKGSYYLNVVTFGQIEEKFFDFKNKVVDFQIFPTAETNKYRGTINLEHQWK